eukprot:TRINITY_DN10739_c0_g1_i1.p1 TRINITY_DN10739_c0_g1~~TRINITY_DN10739_c0_g1_i1.p1  ORF type:complete len:215 (+),score=22.76 TRINITY_DN10739_c0_g1_i1:259-903(+)
MWLDLQPELLFFSSYFTLIILWIEIGYLAKFPSQTIIKRFTWILTVFCVAGLALAGLIFSLVIGLEGPYSDENISKEAYFLAAISCILTVCFVVGCTYLYRRLRQTQSITSMKKKSMLIQFQRLLVVVITCSLAQMTYTLLLELYLEGTITNYTVKEIMWKCYFIFTEQMPTAMILYMVWKTMVIRVTTHTKQAKVEGKLLQPLIMNLSLSESP